MVKYTEQHISDIFHALADPTRRKIIELVAHKEHKASELAAEFNMSFPAVSKHLKILERAHFIKRSVRGRIHRFSFKGQAMKDAQQWIKYYERFWLQNLDQLNDFLKTKDKKKGD